MMAEKISIVVPVLNEAGGRRNETSFLLFLKKLRDFKQCEVIVVDGGSQDATAELVEPYCDVLLLSESGRAKQMNLGARHASGSILLFLHADTFLPSSFCSIITRNMQKKNKYWGRFNVRLSGGEFMFRIIERFMNVRSCLTGIATGDQAMFVRRDLFEKIGGFVDIPLMEDIALSRELKKISWPLCIQSRVLTSSRRWEQYGIWRTIFLMWRLRLAYFFGASPDALKKQYL